jgi:hypothetical protein
MAKFKHPDITSVSIEGKTFEADKDGVFDLPEGEETAAAVQAFGLTAVKAAKPEGDKK